MRTQKKLKPIPLQTVDGQVGIWKDKQVVLLDRQIVQETRQILIAEILPYPGVVGNYRVVEPIYAVNEVAVEWQSEPAKIVVEAE